MFAPLARDYKVYYRHMDVVGLRAFISLSATS
jgi:hypothetical protein